MIIEELFEFNRKVLSKEKDEEVKLLKMGEFLRAKGFKSPESQQLLIDCLDATDQNSLFYSLAMFLAIIFFVILILSGESEIVHPVFFTISASVIGILLLGVFLVIKQMISYERKQISDIIRSEVNKCYSNFSDNKG